MSGNEPSPRPRRFGGRAWAMVAALLAGGLIAVAAGSTIGSADPTPTVPTTTSTTPTTGRVPTVPTASAVIRLPRKTARCAKRLRVVIKRPDGLKLRSLTARIGHHTHTENRNGRFFTVRSLPGGRFRVRVKAVTTGGRSLVVTRHYNGCKK